MYSLRVLFLFILASSINAQGLLSIYKKFIPQAFLNNAESREIVEDNLQTYSQLHPDQIYYYIKFLQATGTKEKNLVSNIHSKTFFENRKKYFQKRSDWADFQIKKLSETDYTNLKKNSMISLFEDFVIDEQIKISDSNFHFDEEANYREYFTYLFLTGKEEKFNSESNYHDLNKKLFLSIIEKQEHTERIFRSLERNRQKKVFNQILITWYLFGEKKYNKYDVSSELEPYLFAQIIEKNKFKTKSGFLLSAYFNPPIHELNQLNHTFSFKDKPAAHLQEQTFSVPINLKYDYSYGLRLGYQFRMKDELAFLSSIKFVAGYSLINSIVVDQFLNQELGNGVFIDQSTGVKKEWEYSSSGTSNLNNHLAEVLISTPIWFYSKNVFIEFGLQFQIEMSQFTYTVNKGIYSSSSSSLLNSEKLVKDYQGSEINVSSHISLIYQTKNLLEFQLSSYSQFNSVLLSLQINYLF